MNTQATRTPATSLRRLTSTLVVALLSLLAVAATPAHARLIVGSTTDPIDFPSDPQQADVTALDIVYDDTAGEFDLRISLDNEPMGGDHLFGTLKLGQSWNGSECVTSSAPYDMAFANSWLFGFRGERTPWQPFGELDMYQSSSFYSSAGVMTRPGTASWEGARLRAIARSDFYVGDAYKGRNYVCAGEFELFRVNQSRYFYGSGVDYVGDFALGGGTAPPPLPPGPGVIDLASPLALDKNEYRPGEVMTATAVWRNPGEAPVTARHLVLTIRPAGMPGNEGYVGDFSPRIDDRTVASHETIAHTSKFQIPAVAGPGNWVLQAVWKDTNDVWHTAAMQPFTISAPQGQTPPSSPGSSPVDPSRSGGGGDRSALLVVTTVHRARLRRALRRGLLVETQLSAAGRVEISALLSARRAVLLGLPRTIGRGSASFSDDATKNVRVRFTGRARRLLNRLSKLKITLKIKTTGESGRQRVTSRAVTLRG